MMKPSKVFFIWATLPISFFNLPLLCYAELSPPNPPHQKPNLILAAGEQRILRIDNMTRYSLGSPIVRALPLPRPIQGSTHLSQNTLLLKGIRPGNTDLWVWKTDGSSEKRNIQVFSLPHRKAPTNLERALGQLGESEIIITGKGVVLRGEVHSLGEARIIAALLRNFPQEVRNETSLSTLLLSQGRTQLESWLDQILRTKRFQSSTNLQLESVAQMLWLRGSVPSLGDKNLIEKEAQKVFPLVQTEIECLPDYAPTIHFKVLLLELSRSHVKNTGISWPTSLEAFISTKGPLHSTGNSASNSISNSIGSRSLGAGPIDFGQLSWALRQLEGKGQAKILSQPELVVRAPGQAEFFAGGELPVQMQSRFYSNISWRSYGLTLHLKITQKAGRKIRLEICTELSHLDGKNSQNGIPGLQISRMKTQVDAQCGAPLFLSGLFRQGTQSGAQGIPFFKNIPVLGFFFRADEVVNEQSELAAILYPSESYPLASPPHSISRILPQGPLPLPRNWLAPEDEIELRQSQDFPWNAFND